ncbi:MAG: undecaprenyl-diphosphatase UppP [Armatimonadota bacterium]
MTLFQAAILGAVQGATEFIPVSSTGHLILVPYVLGWDYQGLTFDMATNVGTLAAVFWYFWREWVAIFSSLARYSINLGRCDETTKDRAKIGIWIILACIPGAVGGVLFKDVIEKTLHHSALFVAATTLIFGLAMLAADRAGRKNRSWASAKLPDWLVMGFAQAVALMPGVSRSGITMSAGLARGLERDAAARCSFLLSAPIIAGATAAQLLGAVMHHSIPAGEMKLFVVGALSAGIVGYLCIKYLLDYLRNHSMDLFVWYRMALAVMIVVIWATRR